MEEASEETEQLSPLFMSISLGNGLNKQPSMAFPRPSIIKHTPVWKEERGQSVMTDYWFEEETVEGWLVSVEMAVKNASAYL